MNSLIESIFKDFTVDGVNIPVCFLYYDGHGEPYVTYQQTDADYSYSGDDDLLGYVDYYDFDVYAKGDYTNIVREIKSILKANDFVWQPSRSSGDMYETDTGYYHKTLSFAYLKGEN